MTPDPRGKPLKQSIIGRASAPHAALADAFRLDRSIYSSAKQTINTASPSNSVSPNAAHAAACRYLISHTQIHRDQAFSQGIREWRTSWKKSSLADLAVLNQILIPLQAGLRRNPPGIGAADNRRIL